MQRYNTFGQRKLRTALAGFLLALAAAGTGYAASFLVTSGADSGSGSLRDAITQANAAAGPHTITFDSSVTTVTLTTQLPTITETVAIDGTPNHSAGTYIDISGGGSTVSGNGLQLDAANCEVYGLYIHGFSNYGIRVNGANATLGAANKGNVVSNNGNEGIRLDGGGAVVRGNIIGLLPDGITAAGNTAGVSSYSAGGDVIGGSAAGEGNVISASTVGNGINFVANNGVARGNYIGTDVTGTLDRGNIAAGIYTQGLNTIIGGASTGEGNLISGNDGQGIQMAGAAGSQVVGNIIGLNAAATLALGNSGKGLLAFGSSNSLTVSGNTICGNAIGGVQIDGSTTSTLINNYIGTTSAGVTTVGNGGSGILLGSGAYGATVSGNTICKASTYGLRVESNYGLTVKGNFVGTNAAGAAGLGNTSHGISVITTATVPSSVASIGGTGSGEGNVVANNGGYGIECNGTNSSSITNNVCYGNTNYGLYIAGAGTVTVQGNTSGLKPDGTTVSANSSGIFLSGSGAHVVGGALASHRNIVSGNTNYGIDVQGANCSIKGNYIGTDATGTLDKGNTLDGIHVGAVSGVVIGGSTAGEGNVIAGNDRRGIDLAASTNCSIVGNTIGLGATGAALANSAIGIYANTNANGLVLTGNTICKNGSYGIRVEGSNTTTIKGNYVGTNSSGTSGLGNSSHGISIVTGSTTVPSATIGGTGVGEGNVIANNSGYGIEFNANGAGSAINNVVFGNSNAGLRLLGTAGHTAKGNYVGLKGDGTTVSANVAGMYLAGSGAHVVGGSSVADRNVISGNTLEGILITTSASGCSVLGNYVGTSASGLVKKANGTSGVRINGSPSVSISGNVIAGNSGEGVLISSGNNASVIGNTIGLAADGATALGNSLNGVNVATGVAGTSIGNGTPAGRNVICSNTQAGLALSATASLDDNYIGVAADGTTARGNGTHGVVISAGGPTVESCLIAHNTSDGINIATSSTRVTGSTIRNNSRDGVRITGAGNSGNTIEQSLIYNNALVQVSLGASVITNNDASDADAGPNQLQNFPQIDPITTGDSAISGKLHSEATESYAVDVYSSSSVSATGYGQAETFVGTTNVTTDGTGVGTFTIPVAPVAGLYYAAIATDASTGSSSAIGRAVTMQSSPRPNVLSVVRATGQTNPTSTLTPVKFTATFSEAVGAATTGDFAPRETGTSGSTVTAIASAFGNSLTLASASDSFVVPAGTSVTLANSSFTWEAWVKRSRTATAENFLQLGTNLTSNNTLSAGFTSADKFTFGFFGNDLTSSIGLAVTGEWHHWAGTYNATTNARKLYLDGVLLASDTAPADFAGTGALYISNTASNPFVGSLDDLRIWNLERTQSEIQNNRFAPLLGSESGLVAYYKFESLSNLGVNGDGADDLADSSSGATHAADATGSPSFTTSGVFATTWDVDTTTGNGAGTVGLDVLASAGLFDNEFFTLSAGHTTGETFTVGPPAGLADWALHQ